VAFDTELVGASAIINAVNTEHGWKLWTIHTVIESLQQFPELGPVNGHMTGSLSWENQRLQDTDSIEPDVLIIGGGQKYVQGVSKVYSVQPFGNVLTLLHAVVWP
jgi:hypothetical protein